MYTDSPSANLPNFLRLQNSRLRNRSTLISPAKTGLVKCYTKIVTRVANEI